MLCRTTGRSITTPTWWRRCASCRAWSPSGANLEPVWLPTDAPWLNPIEKRWRWLRRDVLKGHRLAGDWPQVRTQVNAFLDQFAHGSPALLRSVCLAALCRVDRGRPLSIRPL
jgi:DDE superfamily endonuclease